MFLMLLAVLTKDEQVVDVYRYELIEHIEEFIVHKALEV